MKLLFLFLFDVVPDLVGILMLAWLVINAAHFMFDWHSSLPDWLFMPSTKIKQYLKGGM